MGAAVINSWEEKYDYGVLKRAIVTSVLLHFVAVILIIASHDRPAENFKPLAVFEFAAYDPEGGEASKAPAIKVVPKPEPKPNPKPKLKLNQEPPQIVESISEKAVEMPPAEQPDPKLAAATSELISMTTPDGGASGLGQKRSDAGSAAGYGDGSGQGDPDTLRAYTAMIQQQLNRHKKYPSFAKSRHQEGSVTVGFTVNRQGQVSNARIMKSSGYHDLDDEVLALLRRISLPPIPANINRNSLSLMVPILFRLF